MTKTSNNKQNNNNKLTLRTELAFTFYTRGKKNKAKI